MRNAVTALMVVTVIAAFVYATTLSYYSSVNITSAFSYQSAVVLAQRDSELTEAGQFDRAASAGELRRYETLLSTDLRGIDEKAETPAERAPPFAFPATRRDYERLTTELTGLEALGEERFGQTVASNRRTRDLSNAIFAFVALLFAVLVSRLGRAIEEGRSLVERLQRAFVTEGRELPNTELGSVLISATRGSNVGGDTHDAFTLDRKYAMFFVADVSGKGIEAAVDTAFIKYALRTLFSEDRDPGVMLTKFASLYARSAQNPETFVVLFLAVLDLETGSVRYASAGHEPAWLVRERHVAILPPSGPIVGIDASAIYESCEVRLARGDAFVVSTDGLTESRDARGRLLGAEGVSIWLAELSGSAQKIADAIVRRLRRRSRRITDDLAILVVRYAPGAPASSRAAAGDGREASPAQAHV